MVEKLLTTLYEILGVSYPRVSLVLAAVIGALVFGGAWYLLGKQYEKVTQMRPAIEMNQTAVEPPPAENPVSEPDSLATEPRARDSTLPSTEQPLSKPQYSSDELRNRLKVMHASAMKISSVFTRDSALKELIDFGLAQGSLELVAPFVPDLSYISARDEQYKRILDLMIQREEYDLAESLVEKLSFPSDRDNYYSKILVARK